MGSPVSPVLHPKASLDKHPGAEPLSGYRLLELLGRGGFGEVWKCEAPGGLHKAMKFVAGGGDQYRQELSAFSQVKAIRHPYLLTLERVEVVAGELVMVMELADGQLHDRYRDCLAAGLAGIQRAELLGYLTEAAEALDLMSTRHGLQHLDVKPENLFLVAEHVKIGDYGLVRRAQAGSATSRGVGFTPKYCSPEVQTGRVHSQSDQYSLALVYSEMLTGTFPYPGRTAQELMFQHVHAAPDLKALHPGDQPIVARALSKNPADRFPSCKMFIRALSLVPDTPAPVRIAEPTVQSPPLSPPASTTAEREAFATSAADAPTKPNRASAQPEAAGTEIAASAPTLKPAFGGGLLSPLVGPRTAPPERPSNIREPDRRKKPEQPAEQVLGLPLLVSVDRLHGMSEAAARGPSIAPADFVAELVRFVSACNSAPGGEASTRDAWTCKFLSTIPSALMPLKLAVVGERWGLSVDHRDPTRTVLRWKARNEPRKDARVSTRTPPPQPTAGFEIIVHYALPPSNEFFAVGELFGSPDKEVEEKAEAEVPAIIQAIRGELRNLQERRANPRHLIDMPLRVYPYYSDGIVGQPVAARSLDVSAGGVRFLSPSPIRTQRLFFQFPEVEAIAELAIQGELLRSFADADAKGFVCAAHYRRIRLPATCNK